MRNWTAQVMSGKRRTARRRFGKVKARRCTSKRAVKYLYFGGERKGEGGGV